MLICVSVKYAARCQTRAMMSQQYCTQKAEMCEARFAARPDTIHAADWLEMAAQWRALAGDRNGQATTARLMNMNGVVH